jgi:uncharacterized protein YbjQ (UPF0145 family)
MMRHVIVLITVCLLASGCSIYHVKSEDVSSEYYPSKRLASDVVYLDRIEKPHTVIGYITVNTERRWTIDDVLEKMKREAAILGGDAITNIQTDASGAWKKLPAQELLGNAYVRANFNCSVAVFK